MTFCSCSVQFQLFLGYRDRMQLRCFLFRYSVGSEVIRWFRPLTDRDVGWVQQIMVQRLPDGLIAHTEHDSSAIFFMPGVMDLIATGRCEEL